MSLRLAADIGGTNIRLAIIDNDGNIIAESRIQAALSQHHASSTQASETYIIQTISQAITSFLATHTHAIDAIGIGFPGFFHGKSGVLASSPNLPGLIDFPLAKLLEQRLNKPVSVQNDALCAAIGEHHFGAGKGQANLLHITLGTGVGGGLILNHQPYGGEHGMAMEFGHLRVQHDNSKQEARLCGCGNYDCLEAYASATAVVQRYAERFDTPVDTQTNRPSSAQAIYQAACKNDQHAIAVITQAGSYLGQAMAETIKLLDISTITVSGGLSGAWSLLHPALMQSLNHNLIPPLKGKVHVLRSTLADNAGLLGAAAIAQ